MKLQTYTVFGIWREAVRLARPLSATLVPLVVPGLLVVLILAFAVATGIRFESNPFPSIPGANSGGQRAMLMVASVPLIGTVALMGVLNLMVLPVAVIALTHRVVDVNLSRSEIYHRFLTFLFPLLGSMLLAYVINGVAAFLGLMLMVVPGPILGLLFYTWYQFVPAVVILEGEGGGGALRRSRSLTRDYFWKVSGSVTIPLVLEFLLVGQILMFASDLLYSTIGLGSWALLAICLALLLLAALECVKLLIGVLLYLDLRIRKDGLDIPMLTHELEEYEA